MQNGQFAFVIPFLIWGAEFVLPTLSACVGPIIYGALAGAVVYGGYQVTQALNKNPISWTYIPPTPVLSDFLYQDNYLLADTFDYRILNKKENERYSSDKPGSPPHRGDELGNDPAKQTKGYEWKGKGKPGSAEGNWVKGPKGSQETLHPDLNHPNPIGPHWDYDGPNFPDGARLYPNGTWSPK